MAISLEKTLQTVAYTLYIITKLNTTLQSQQEIVVTQDIYQSSGHYNDNFLPIITLHPVIESENALTAIRALLQSDMAAAVTAAEQYLIGADAYYSGGEIVA